MPRIRNRRWKGQCFSIGTIGAQQEYVFYNRSAVLVTSSRGEKKLAHWLFTRELSPFSNERSAWPRGFLHLHQTFFLFVNSRLPSVLLLTFKQSKKTRTNSLSLWCWNNICQDPCPPFATFNPSFFVRSKWLSKHEPKNSKRTGNQLRCNRRQIQLKVAETTVTRYWSAQLGRPESTPTTPHLVSTGRHNHNRERLSSILVDKSIKEQRRRVYK